MKRGLIFGFVAWIAGLVTGALVAPLIVHGNMAAFGRSWFSLSFLIVGVPAFLIGYFNRKKEA